MKSVLTFLKKISDADLQMLVEKVLVHQNEDKSLDVQPYPGRCVRAERDKV